MKISFAAGNRRPLVCALALALAAGFATSACATDAPATTPQAWSMYALTPGHNAVHHSAFPAVSWRFDAPGAAAAKANPLLNPTMIRDLVGFAIGVAVVDDTVYATNDDGFLYAVDAQTGKLRWRFRAFNQLMGTPIIAKVGDHKLVFVGGGNSVFAYSHAVNFGKPGGRVIRGNGLSAMYAVDAATGKQVWAYPTAGEDMPTPVFYKGHVLFGNGDGHVYSLDAATGKLAWKTDIQSFVSMSSATLDPASGTLVMGGTQPSRIYGLDATTGKQLWAVTPPGVFSSSAGDGTWAIAGHTAVGQIETRDATQAQAGTSASEELAIDLATGKIVWSTTLGSGKTPPRNKDAVPTVVDGVIYTGSPVTHHEYALDAATGKIRWQRAMPASMKAAPAVVGRFVIQPTSSGDIVTLDAASGKIVHTFNRHEGGYGPQNGVVVGHTWFNGTNAGALQAIPLKDLGVTL